MITECCFLKREKTISTNLNNTGINTVLQCAVLEPDFFAPKRFGRMKREREKKKRKIKIGLGLVS